MNAGGPRPWQFGESSPEPARVVLTTAPHPPVVSVAYREIGPLHWRDGGIGPVVRREEDGLRVNAALEDSVVLTRVRIVLECSSHLVEGCVWKIEVLLVHSCR